MKINRKIICIIFAGSIIIHSCLSIASTNGELKPIRTIKEFKEVNWFSFLEGGKYLSLEGKKQNKSGVFLLEEAFGFQKGKYIPIDSYQIRGSVRGAFYFIDRYRRLKKYFNEKVVVISQDPVFAYRIIGNEVFFQAVDKNKMKCYISSTKYSKQKIYLDDLDVTEGSDAGNISPSSVFWAPDGTKILYYPTSWKKDKASFVEVKVVSYPNGNIFSFKMDVASEFQWSNNTDLVLYINKSGYTGYLNIIDINKKKIVKVFPGMYSSAIWNTETKILAMKNASNQNILVLLNYLENSSTEKWKGPEVPYNLKYSSKNEVVAFNTIGNGKDTIKIIWLNSMKTKIIISQNENRIAGWDLADNGYIVVRFRNKERKEMVNLYKYL